ncbi:MAG TPA: helix-turn-helix transcriptional regulator [Hyphomicrobiaceae bacterium]|nr:helix-turn-helix transcriptional regulator [Hyphomicrobiaceae bacterium]
MARDVRELEGAFISEIYAALLGHGDWQVFLSRLTAIMPNGKGTLFYHDAAAGAGALSLSANMDATSIDAYNRHFGGRNPWMAKAMLRPLGLGVRAEQMFPPDQLLRTEFYNDFLRLEGVQSGVGVTIFRERGCNFMLSLMSVPVDDAEGKAAAELLGRLAPHLRQAFAYYRGAKPGGAAPPFVGAITDALTVACVAIGFERSVRWANAAGWRLLTEGSRIGIDVRGRLKARSAELREAIALAQAAADRQDGAGTRVLSVRRQNEGETAARVTLVVPALAPFERFFAGPVVLLLVEEEPQRVGIPTEASLRQAFALTNAESRLALALANGSSLAAAAEGLQISRHTARAHLKSIFAKTQVHRQAELVVALRKLSHG